MQTDQLNYKNHCFITEKTAVIRTKKKFLDSAAVEITVNLDI